MQRRKVGKKGFILTTHLYFMTSEFHTLRNSHTKLKTNYRATTEHF